METRRDGARFGIMSSMKGMMKRLAASAAVGLAAAVQAAWNPGEPATTYWFGPGCPGEYGMPLTDFWAKQLREGGFNTVWANTPEELDIAAKHGLRAIYSVDPTTEWAKVDLDDPDQKAKLAARVNRVKNHPALYIYEHYDEASAELFPALARVKNFIRELDPEHPCWHNLLPTYANHKQLGVGGKEDEPQRLGFGGDRIAAYWEHVRLFCDVYQPEFIKYDHYQLKTNGDSRNYFLNLGIVQQNAAARRVPFWNGLQACTWTPGSLASPRSPRIPGVDEMRYLAHTTAAYGASGLYWYVYGCKGHRGVIAETNGVVGAKYEGVKRINREFIAFSKALRGCSLKAAYMHGVHAPGTTPCAWQTLFKISPEVPHREVNELERHEDTTLATHLVSPEGRTYLMFVNCDYRKDRTITVGVSSDAERFDPADGGWSPVGRTFDLSLVRGGGALLRIASATEPPPCAPPAADASARWISYPGDYALWRGNDLQARRIEFGGKGYPVFWASYAPHPLVEFRKDVELENPETADVACEGVCRIKALGKPPLQGVSSNKFTFPAGKYTISARVYSQGAPPAIYIGGPTVKTDSSWQADWRMEAAWQPGETPPPAESGGRTLEARPSQMALPTRRAEPASQKRIRGNHVFADFGRETFGFLRLKGVKGRGRVRIVYGESEPEAMCEDFSGPDQWEFVSAEPGPEQRLEVSRGWRYVHVIPEAGVSVEGVAMDEELCPLSRAGSFRSSDELLNRIWNVSARTLELTSRELYIEGAKRDRWTWSGDARQSYLMGYYLFGESGLAKDTLFYQRGGDPVVMHINRIMDYTFYWFMSVREYYLYTGDRLFLEQIYDRMESLMDFVVGRLDGRGRPHDMPGDWMFIDWAPERLRNTGGVTSFEQMLLVEALDAMAEASAVVGRGDEAAYRERAAKLRSEIVPLFWSEGRGALMHLLKDDGALDAQLTRYANMFGLALGYFDSAKRESVLKNVMFNDSVMKIQTPYMRFYELEALCRLGLNKRMLHEVRDYWGGMLDEGATSFWELYNPSEKGDAKYAMYGRPFGKSLCHAWGAGPVYLFGRYVLGVEPSKPGYAEYVVAPNLGGLDWVEGTVPTPRGPITVSVRNGVAEATGPAGCSGILRWRGKTATIPCREDPR